MAANRSALQILRRNDPGNTNIYIALDVNADVEFSEALEANEHVNKITLDLRGMRGHWDSLLRVISTCGNLGEVCLRDHYEAEQRNPPEATTCFFSAIQQNPAIHVVHLNDARLSGTSLASFLDTATSVTTFGLDRCDMGAFERERGGLRELSSSLQRNRKIRKLILANLDDSFILPILSSLESNAIVKELVLLPESASQASSLAIQRILESTSTLERFELSFSEYEEEAFRPIAEGLINNKSITSVKLDECSFDDVASALLFKSNLHSLSISSVYLHGGRQPPSMLFTNLLHPASSLRSLDLSCEHFHYFGCTTSEKFVAFMKAVERSQLERFRLGRIPSPEMFHALILSIPKMQARSLDLDLSYGLEHLKPDLIQAVKKNASLRTVVANLYHGDFFDEDDKRNLKEYAARNEDIYLWIASPASMCMGAWPKALETALVTGPDTVFRLLRCSVNLWVKYAESAVASTRRPNPLFFDKVDTLLDQM